MTCKLFFYAILGVVTTLLIPRSIFAQATAEKPEHPAVRCNEYTRQLHQHNQTLVVINQVGQKYACSYGIIDRSDYIKFEERLIKAIDTYKALQQLSKNWDELLKAYPNNVEYSAKSAETKLLLVAVCHRISDYVEFNSALPQRLLEKMDKDDSELKQELILYKDSWLRDKETYLQQMRGNLADIEKQAPNRWELKFMRAAESYYQGNIAKARIAFGTLLNETKVSKDLTDEIKERSLFVINTWIAFLDLEEGKLKDSNTSLEALRAYSTIQPSYLVEWSNTAFEASYNIINRGHEWRNQYLKLPVQEEKYTISETTLSIFDKKGVEEDYFHFQPSVGQSIVEPGTQYKATKQIWDEIQDIEGTIVLMNIKHRQQKKPKIEAGFYGFENLPGNNHAVQIKKHKARYKSIEQILNQLAITKKGWDILIENNPNTLIFRAYRVKTNLAYHYMQSNKNNILEFLRYYKPKGWVFGKNKTVLAQEQAIEKLNQGFGMPALKEIDADLQFIKARAPEHSLSLITEAEVLAYTTDPQTAIKQIESLNNKVSEEATIYGTNVRELFKFYSMVASYRLGTNDGLNDMAGKSVELTKNTAISEQIQHVQEIQNERVLLYNPKK